MRACEAYQQELEHQEWLESNLPKHEEKKMDMNQYAGNESKYLKASDLQGSRPKVTISSVELIEFDDDEKGKSTKPGVGFEGKDKKMIFNATSVEEMIRAFGSDSDGWIGKQLILSTKFYPKFDREGLVISPVVEETFIDDDIPF